ncbi:serine hydrolase domain-containing protein [uncultured Aquimarina sp.]|uniref:serine hydrolase domain-containing protein n=1 Tax=uncultured Aquimarina sp. TaxID=575652 RepID=UPI00260586A5|nr:serine hydrolase domain-containing protein [uncultured Aquimarina sp.]
MKTFLIILGSFLLLGIVALVGLFFYFKNANKIEIVPATSSLVTRENIDQEKVDSIFKYTKNFPDNTQLSFAFIDADTVSYYGTLRKDKVFTTVKNSDAVFHIGSITKVFTSTLLADFAIHKEVDLDAPIQEFMDIPLNKIKKEGKSITLKMLSNHTSGLPRLPSGMMMSSIMNPDNPYANYTQEKLNTYLKDKMKPKRIPGTSMEYSNLGAGLLGDILANISKKTYEELVQERIFSKYKMTSSTMIPEKVAEKTIDGLTAKGTIAQPWTKQTLHGAGGVLSNVEDLSKFAIANFKKDTVLDFQRIKTFEKNKKMSVSLGWHIITSKTGDELYFHNGATGGYMSSMLLNTKNKKGVIILSNINFLHPDSKNLDKLCFTLMGMQP